MSATKTVYRVKLRLASYDESGALTWQRLVVDRPNAHEASELIKWAYGLDEENGVTRSFDCMCSVARQPIDEDGRGTVPLADVIASLKESFTLRKV
jgi:hypothetical protein